MQNKTKELIETNQNLTRVSYELKSYLWIVYRLTLRTWNKKIILALLLLLLLSNYQVVDQKRVHFFGLHNNKELIIHL